MKSPGILASVALALVAAVTAAAQPTTVYSVNVVGYVVVNLNPGLNLIANPLNGTNNHLRTILPLPDTADGTVVFRFDDATQSYRDAFTFLAGVGWYPASGDVNDPAMTLAPGEGFYIEPGNATLTNVVFVGEVLQGTLVNPIPANYSLKASMVPQAGALVSTLMFPPAEGDRILQWDAAAQAFRGPVGRFVDGAWDPQEPTISVAEGFVVWRDPSQATQDQWWVRSFTVEPSPIPQAAIPASIVSGPPVIRNLSVTAGQVKLEIDNPSETRYAVQFSRDASLWITVAGSQTATTWSAPLPPGPRGCYRVIQL